MVFNISCRNTDCHLVTYKDHTAVHGTLCGQVIFIYLVLSMSHKSLVILRTEQAQNKRTHTLLPCKVPTYHILPSPLTLCISCNIQSSVKLRGKIRVIQQVTNNYIWVTIPDVIFLCLPWGHMLKIIVRGPKADMHCHRASPYCIASMVV